MKDIILNKLTPSRVRNIVQAGFAAFLLYVGYRFYLWVEFYRSGGVAEYVSRPAAVEGFLPIAALVGLKNWLANGVFDEVHPAGLVILLTIILISLLYRKSFCSWLCPVGTLSEAVGRLGRKVFGRNINLPKWLDYPLMGLKYVLLAFFLYFILIGMDGQAALEFMYSPYNTVADIKMMDFFLNLGSTKLLVILGLIIGSVFIRNFWCRYLCPYGALLGLFSWLSPVKISRNDEECINCGKCTRACPNRIQVASLAKVNSVECTGCLECVSNCPRTEALNLTLLAKKKINPLVFPALVLGTFLLVVTVAKLTGHWETVLTHEYYQQIIPAISSISH
ncbi:MAG: 4Fe-4S binding protein [Clostridia bacterium]|nr:4Fe-4S binding protein [Clostridia bacterium]